MSTRLALALVIATIFGFLAAFCVFRHLSVPEGMFDCPRLGAEGFSYFCFSNGQVRLITPDGNVPYGSYGKENEKWVWKTRTGHKLYLTASWKELRVFRPDGNEESSYSGLRRLFFKPKRTKKKSNP